MKSVIAIYTFLLIATSCKTQDAKDLSCLEKAFDIMLVNDNHSKLYKNDSLLIVINFTSSDNDTFRAAIFSKSWYSKYLVGKSQNQVQGFFHYKNIIVLVYGIVPSFLDLRPAEEGMYFLKPAKRPEPKEGYPPLPPILVEPEVFTFNNSQDCYELVRKSMADTLIQ